MKRNGDEVPLKLSGEGIIDNNVGFIKYNVLGTTSGNKTYGTMVITFTNSKPIKIKTAY